MPMPMPGRGWYARSGSAGSLYSIRYHFACVKIGAGPQNYGVRRRAVRARAGGAFRGVRKTTSMWFSASPFPIPCSPIRSNSKAPCWLCRFRVWTYQTLPSILPLALPGNLTYLQYSIVQYLGTADSISPTHGTALACRRAFPDIQSKAGTGLDLMSSIIAPKLFDIFDIFDTVSIQFGNLVQPTQRERSTYSDCLKHPPANHPSARQQRN